MTGSHIGFWTNVFELSPQVWLPCVLAATQLLTHCGVQVRLLLETIRRPPHATVGVLKLKTDGLVLKNEEPVYKLGLSCTPYEKGVLSLEFLNAGHLYPAFFGEGAFSLLFVAESGRFATALIMIWSRAVNVSLDLRAPTPSGRGLSRGSCLRVSVAATCVSMRARFSTPVLSILRRSAACSCLRASHACCSRRACALASSASHCCRSHSFWACVAIPPEAVDLELDTDLREEAACCRLRACAEGAYMVRPRYQTDREV
jgi:hypothetical protein